MQSQHLKEAYERYASELTQFLRRLTRRRGADADDIAQTAFLKLATLETSAVENPRAFLYATARNLVVDELRHRSHVERANTRAESADDCDEMSPERITLDREQLQIVEQAILALPPKRRRVFILRRIQNLSYQQIARETGLTVATVKQHVIRSLADCRRALAAQAEGARIARPGKSQP